LGLPPKAKACRNQDAQQVRSSTWQLPAVDSSSSSEVVRSGFQVS
jgi:hypothetical protein